MIRAIRTELLKVRTTRLLVGLLATTAALTALITVIGAARAGGGTGQMEIPPLYTRTGLTDILTRTGFGLLLASVFGVAIASGESRHATATATYLATPNRLRVLIAKVVTATLAGLLFGLISAGLTTAIVLAFVSAKGYAVALSTATIVRFATGAIVGAGLLAALGVGVGSLLRSQLAAIVTVFAWGFVLEQILGGLYGSVQPYLPFTAAGALAGSPLGNGPNPLPFAAGAALVAGIAVVMSSIAAATTVRRDIT